MGKWKNDYNASRKYNQKWEEGRGWLQSTPDEKCYCNVCHSTFKPKKSVVQQHELSTKHRFAMEGLEKPKRVYRKLKTEVIDDTEKEENITFRVLSEDDPLSISGAFQNIRESGNRILQRALIPKSIPTKIEYVDGAHVSFLNDQTEQSIHESEDPLQKIVKNVTTTFKSDLERFLKKDTAFIKFIESNEDYSSGVSGVARLTRMLVGRMAQNYLFEYTVDSWKNRSIASCSNNMYASKLNNIEKSIEQSMRAMKSIKEELSSESEAQSMLMQPAIVLDSINVDI